MCKAEFLLQGREFGHQYTYGVYIFWVLGLEEDLTLTYTSSCHIHLLHVGLGVHETRPRTFHGLFILQGKNRSNDTDLTGIYVGEPR
jgi:hypothetical protein